MDLHFAAGQVQASCGHGLGPTALFVLRLGLREPLASGKVPPCPLACVIRMVSLGVANLPLSSSGRCLASVCLSCLRVTCLVTVGHFVPSAGFQGGDAGVCQHAGSWSGRGLVFSDKKKTKTKNKRAFIDLSE